MVSVGGSPGQVTSEEVVKGLCGLRQQEELSRMSSAYQHGQLLNAKDGEEL